MRPGAALGFRSYGVSAPFALSRSWSPLSSAYVVGAAGIRCGRRTSRAPRGGRNAVYVSGLAGASGGRGPERLCAFPGAQLAQAAAGAGRSSQVRQSARAGGARRARGRAFRSPAAAGPPPESANGRARRCHVFAAAEAAAAAEVDLGSASATRAAAAAAAAAGLRSQRRRWTRWWRRRRSG